MVAPSSIVCAVDFSDQSRDALRWAVALAAHDGSRVTLLTVVEPLLAEAARVRFRLDLAHTETAPALREFLHTVIPAAATWAPQINIDVRIGDPAGVILDEAAREHADLIVMGTHGLGGFRKLLLGSTTERVLRRANTTLLVVPHQDRQAVTLESDGPRFTLTRILAASDFSASSTEACRWAANLAQRLATPLLLTHVVVPVPVLAQWQSYVAEVDEERARTARARLGLIDPHAENAPRPGSVAYRVVCLAHVPVVLVPAHS